MQTKELPIQQAKEWEVYGDKVVWNSQDFKKELHKYGVRDLFDNQLTIKQDKEKYIFAINGVNKFAVNGKVDFTTFINDLYKDLAETEKRGAEKRVVIEVSELEKRTKVEIIYTETEKDLKELEEQIRKNEKLQEKATDIENVKFKVERLIAFFEQEKDLTNESIWWFLWRKYDRKDTWMRRINKVEIKRRLTELYKIKKQVERLASNKGKKYTINRDNQEFKDVKMDDVNGMDMKMTLKQFSDRIEDLGKEAPNFILARNEIILEQTDTVPYFEIMGYTTKDAGKISKSLRKVNNEYAILDELKLTWAKRQELSQDLQDLEKYLNNVINHPDTFKPSEHPFVPTHIKDFCALLGIEPTPEQYKQLNNQAGNTSTENNNGNGANNNVENNQWNQQNKTWSERVPTNYGNTKEAFEKWGINWTINYRLDKSSMKPEQKQFWWWVGNLAITGWMIFVGWKMIKSAWNLITGKNKDDPKKKNADRARLLGPAALIFWTQARAGEGPLGLFKWGPLSEKLVNLFGWGKNKETGDKTPQDKETHDKYAEWFPGATALFNGLTYGEMKQFLIKDGDQMKVDPDKYDTLLDMFKSGSKKNEAAAAFLESMGRKDERHVLDLGLTGMGITRDQIEDDSNKDKKFDKTASEAIVRLRSVTIFMDDKKYNKVNSETQHLVDEYIREGKPTLEDLAERGDVFYEELNTIDQTGLTDKIKELANGNKQREEDLLLAVNTFYNKMPSTNKKIELTGTRPTITFGTYEQSSTINLENKELVGFTPKQFTSYFEVFKAANLTNRIKFLCKDKQAKSEKPFYLSTPGRDITFDDEELFSTKFDTEIMTAGRWGSLKKVSPTLEKDKQSYCDYLNASTPKFWKPKTTV